VARAAKWRRIANELQALWRLQRGDSQEDIAAELGVSPTALISSLDRARTDEQIRDLDRWRQQVFDELQALKLLFLERYMSNEMLILRRVTETPSGVVVTTEERPIGMDAGALTAIQAIIADQRRLLGLDAPQQSRSVALNITPREVERLARDVKSLTLEELEQLVDRLGVRELMDLPGAFSEEGVDRNAHGSGVDPGDYC